MERLRNQTQSDNQDEEVEPLPDPLSMSHVNTWTEASQALSALEEFLATKEQFGLADDVEKLHQKLDSMRRYQQVQTNLDNFVARVPTAQRTVERRTEAIGSTLDLNIQ